MKHYLSKYSPELEALFHTFLVIFMGIAAGGIFGYVVENYGVEPLIYVGGVYIIAMSIWLVYSVTLDRIKAERRIAEIASKYDQK